MRPLTSSRGRLPDGIPYGVYEVLGRKVRVLDSLRNGVLAEEVIRDPLFEPEERAAIVCGIVLPDPEGFAEEFGSEAGEAVLGVLEAAFGFSEDSGDRVLDFAEDAARIRATARAAYGLSPEELSEMPFSEAVELIAMAPRDTPVGQALYYRTAEPPKRTKSNGEQVDAWLEAREHYRIKGDWGEEDANAAATAMFDRLAGD